MIYSLNKYSLIQFYLLIFFFVYLQLYQLRRLMQGSENTPKAPLGNNARPVQNLHHRTVRTNIDFKKTKVSFLRNNIIKDIFKKYFHIKAFLKHFIYKFLLYFSFL